MALFFLTLLCRKICKRICVAGSDPSIVESPTEPKWSSSGTEIDYLVEEQNFKFSLGKLIVASFYVLL